MKEFIHIYKHLLTSYPQLLKKGDKEKLKKLAPHLDRNTLIEKLQIINIVLKEIGLGRTSVISILLSNEVAQMKDIIVKEVSVPVENIAIIEVN